MNKRKLVISLILGTVALSVIGLSASLAWYASSDRLLVNTIDLDLRTDESVGLYISTRPEEESFKESLDTSELNEVKEFIPASSMFHDRWVSEKKGVPEFYEFTEHDTSGEPQFNPKSDGFFQQKLYLLNNINYYVTLDPEQTFITCDKTANNLRAQALAGKVSSLTVDEIEEKLNQLENSMRFSILVNTPKFYQYYIVDPNKDENKVTYYAGRLDVNADDYFDTFDGKEILYGQVENREAIAYDNPEDPTFTKPFKETKNEFFGNAFDGKTDKSAYTYNEQNSLQAGVKYKEEPSISLDDIASDDNPLLIPCYNGVPTEIVLSIYLEGWDLDCYNSTMGASFNAQLSFKLLRGII